MLGLQTVGWWWKCSDMNAQVYSLPEHGCPHDGSQVGTKRRDVKQLRHLCVKARSVSCRACFCMDGRRRHRDPSILQIHEIRDVLKAMVLLWNMRPSGAGNVSPSYCLPGYTEMVRRS